MGEEKKKRSSARKMRTKRPFLIFNQVDVRHLPTSQGNPIAKDLINEAAKVWNQRYYTMPLFIKTGSYSHYDKPYMNLLLRIRLLNRKKSLDFLRTHPHQRLEKKKNEEKRRKEFEKLSPHQVLSRINTELTVAIADALSALGLFESRAVRLIARRVSRRLIVNQQKTTLKGLVLESAASELPKEEKAKEKALDLLATMALRDIPSIIQRCWIGVGDKPKATSPYEDNKRVLEGVNMRMSDIKRKIWLDALRVKKMCSTMSRIYAASLSVVLKK